MSDANTGTKVPRFSQRNYAMYRHELLGHLAAIGGGTGVPMVDRPPVYVTPLGANPLATAQVKSRETREEERKTDQWS